MFYVRSHSKQSKLARFYGTEERFQVMLVAFSYISSLLIALITVIVEFASPKCAPYRPKFAIVTPNGVGSCFFNGKVFLKSHVFNI